MFDFERYSKLEGRFGDQFRFNLLLNPAFQKSTEKYLQSNNVDLDDPYFSTSDSYKKVFTSLANDYNSEVLEEVYSSTISESIGENFREQVSQNISDSNKTLRRLFRAYEGITPEQYKDGEDLGGFGAFTNYIFKGRYEGGTNQAYQYAEQALDELSRRELINSGNDYRHVSKEIDRFLIEKERQNQFNLVNSSIPELTDDNLNRGRRLLENIRYINRPGILPAVALIEGSKNNLWIDIYQLQNSSIRSTLITKVLQAIHDPNRNADNPFILNLRMASPVENNAANYTGYDILGPNLILYNTLQMINTYVNQPGNEHLASRVQINARWADKKNHPKFSMNDNTVIIGTMNWTDPLGSSIYQAGSNYEQLNLLHNNLNKAVDANGRPISSVSYTEIMEESITTAPEQLTGLISRARKLGADSSTLMYLQARSVMASVFASKEGLVKYNNRNIAAPTEIFEQLSNTIKKVQEINKSSIKTQATLLLNLNQVFLFSIDELDPDKAGSIDPKNYMANRQLLGEMGPDTEADQAKYKSFLRNKVSVFRDQIQIPILDLIIEGRANVVVDPHNYRETIQNPLHQRLSDLGVIGSGSKYGYDILSFIKKAGNASDRIDAQRNIEKVLRSEFGVSSPSATYLTKLMFAVSSGNIQIASTPRSHTKSYFAVEHSIDYNPLKDINDTLHRIQTGEVEVLSGYTGSSNLSVRSTALGDSLEERASTNRETGFQLLNQLKFKSEIDTGKIEKGLLEYEEELFELKIKANQFFESRQEIGRGGPGLDTKSIYTGRVDIGRLETLFKNLTSIAESTGSKLIEVERVFDDLNRPSELRVKIASASGPKVYSFTTLQGGGVLAINQGKVISNAMIVNTTNTDLILGTGDYRKVITAGTRQFVDSDFHVLSLVSTLALQFEQSRLINQPFSYYEKYFKTGFYSTDGSLNREAAVSAGINFFGSIFGGVGTTPNDLLKLSQEDIIKNTIVKFENRLNTDVNLGRIRDIAGIDVNSQVRLEGMSQLRSAIRDFSDAAESERASKASNLISTLYNIFNTRGSQFTDLLYLFVESQNDSRYKLDKQEEVTGIHNRLFEAYLTETQYRVYSSDQGADASPVYGLKGSTTGEGIGDRLATVISNASQSLNTGAKGLRALTSMSILSNIFSFNATTNLGKGDEPIFTKVAEGGALNELGELSEEISKMPNYNPMSRTGKIIQVYKTELVAKTGVGVLIDNIALTNYLNTLKGKFSDAELKVIETELRAELEKYGGVVVNYNFEKGAQIPQRLKNVIGSRPLHQLTSTLKNLMDSPGGDTKYSYKYESIDSQGNKRYTTGSSNITNSLELVDHYKKGLQQALQDIGKGAYSNLIDDRFDYGAYISDTIGTFVGSTAAIKLEEFRLKVQSEFGLTREQTFYGVGKEILRALIVEDKVSLGAGGSPLGRETVNHKPPQVILALSGAFSDYGYLNPYYDVKEGFVDKKTVSQKASLFTLSADGRSFSINDDLKIKGGFISVQQEDENKFLVYDEKGNLNQVINSRDEFDVLLKTLESMGGIKSAGKVIATSNVPTNRGQSPKELIYKVSTLAGNDSKNEIQIQINYLRTFDPTSGRRLEGTSGALPKIVPQFLGKGYMQRLYDEYIEKHYLVGGRNVDISDIKGIFSTTNFKSYNYEHGATILVQKEFEDRLNASKADDAKIAASILFGSNILAAHSKSINAGELNNVLELYATKALSGELGTYLKTRAIELATKGTATKDGRIELGKKLQQLGHMKTDKNFNPFSSSLIKGISIEDLLSALQGKSNGQLKSKLVDLLQGQYNTSYNGAPIDNSIAGRELASLTGGIDIALQLIANRSQLRMELVPLQGILQRGTLKGASEIELHAFRSIAVMTGIKTLDETYLEENLDVIAAYLDEISNQVNFVQIYSSVAGSQSKPPVSSKPKVNQELQYMVPEAFLAHVDAFRSSGNINSMRKLVANLMAFAAGTTEERFYKGTERVGVMYLIDVVDDSGNLIKADYFRSAQFLTKMSSFYNSKLITESKFQSIQAKYELFSNLKQLLSTNYGNDPEFVSRVIFNFESQINKSNGKYNKIKNDPEVKSFLTQLKSRTFQKKGKNSLGDNLTSYINHINTIVEAYYNSTYSELEGIAEAYRAYGDKVQSLDLAGSILDGLASSGLGTTGFAVPSMIIENDGTLIVDRTNLVYGMSLGAQEIKNIGEQYGTFQSELSKYAIVIYEAFAPGSAVRQVLNKIERLSGDTVTLNDLTKEELNAITRFNEAIAKNEIAMATTLQGQKISEVMGNKVGMPGSTAVASASFFLPMRGSVIPTASTDKAGGVAGKTRQQYIDTITEFYNDFVDFNKYYAVEQATKFIEANSESILNNVRDVEQEYYENKLNHDYGDFNDIKTITLRLHTIEDKLDKDNKLIEEATKNIIDTTSQGKIDELTRVSESSSLAVDIVRARLNEIKEQKREIGRQLGFATKEERRERRKYLKDNKITMMLYSPQLKDLFDSRKEFKQTLEIINEELNLYKDEIKEAKKYRDLRLEEVKTKASQIDAYYNKYAETINVIDIQLNYIHKIFNDFKDKEASVIKAKARDRFAKLFPHLQDIVNANIIYNKGIQDKSQKKITDILTLRQHELKNQRQSYYDDRKKFIEESRFERSEQLLYAVRQYLNDLNDKKSDLEYRKGNEIKSLYFLNAYINQLSTQEKEELKAHKEAEKFERHHALKLLKAEESKLIKLIEQRDRLNSSKGIIDNSVGLENLPKALEYIDSSYNYNLLSQFKGYIDNPLKKSVAHYLLSQRTAMEKGMSAIGTNLLADLMNYSKEVQNILENNNLGEKELKELGKKIDTKLKEVDGLGKFEPNHADVYAVELYRLELKTLQLDIKQRTKPDSVTDAIEIQIARTQTVFLENLPTPIGGLRIGSKSKLKENIENTNRRLTTPDKKLINNTNELFLLAEENRKGSNLSDKLKTQNIIKSKEEGINYANQMLIVSKKQLEDINTLVGPAYAKYAKEILTINSNFQSSMNKLIERLKIEGDNPYKLNEIIYQIESELDKFNTQSKLYFLESARSSPPGLMEKARSINVNMSLSGVNELIGDITFRDRNGEYKITDYFSIEKGKTMTMFNPISILVTMLGDYDGDMISSIYMDKTKYEIQKQDLIAHRDKITKQFEYDINLLTAGIKDTEKISDEFNKQIEEVSDRYSEEIERIDKSIKDKSNLIEKIDSNMEFKSFEESIRRWASGYMKVDEEVFIKGTDAKGQNIYMSSSEILPLVEQARGLFPNLENAYASNPFFKDLTELSNRSQNMSNVDNMLSMLNVINPEAKYLDFLTNTEEGREAARDLYTQVFLEGGNSKDIKQRLGRYIGNLYNSVISHKNNEKTGKLAAGLNISPENYEAMQATLGQAGSVLLGKVYNSTIGLLYNQSPFLALGEVLETNGDLRDQLAGALGGTDKVEELIKHTRNAKKYALQVAGFLQDTHQLMRDSIKPKDAQKFLEELKKYNDAFNSGDEATRLEAIQGMTTLIDVKGINNIEAYVATFGEIHKYAKDVDINNYIINLQSRTDITEKLDNIKAVFSQFQGVSINKLNENYHRIRESLGDNADDFFNQNKAKGKYEIEVALAYQIKQDLVNMNAKYAFEKFTASDGFEVTKDAVTGESKLTAKIEGVANNSVGLIQNFLSGVGQQYKGAVDNLVGGLSVYDKDLTVSQLEFKSFVRDTYGLGDDAVFGLADPTSRQMMEVMAYQYIHSVNQVELFSGRYGEGLVRFGHYDIERRNAYSGNFDGSPVGLTQNDPLLTTITQAMSVGKLDNPQALAGAFQALITGAGDGGRGQGLTRADVFMQAINLIDENIGTGIPSVFEEIKAALDNEAGREFLNSSDFAKAIEATAFGQQASTIEELVNAASAETDAYLNTEEKIRNYYKKQGLKGSTLDKAVEATKLEISLRQNDKNINNNINTASNIDNQSPTNFIDYLLKAPDQLSPNTFTKAIQTGAKGSFSSLSNSLAKNSENLADVALFPLLGLLGNVIATGDVSPESIQQTVGNTISAFAYINAASNREGKLFGLRTSNQMFVSSAFKYRLSANEDPEGIGAGLLKTVASEVAFGSVAVITHKFFTKSMNYQLEHGVLSSVINSSKLDIEGFEGIKSTFGNLVAGAATYIAAQAVSTLVGSGVERLTSSAANFVTSGANLIGAQIDATINELRRAKFSNTDIVSDSDYEDSESVTNEDGSFVAYIQSISYSIEDQSTAEALFTEPIEDSLITNWGDSNSNDLYSLNI